MGIKAGQAPIEIRVDEGSTTATLYISEKQDTVTLERDAVLALIKEKRVALSPDVEARIDEIIEDFKNNPRRVEGVIKEAFPATHGEDAYFDWTPDKDPTAPCRPAPKSPTDDPVDFYNMSCMIRVKPNDVIAQFHEATIGTNGCDIYGRVIEARPGKETEITLDPSLTKQDDGRIVANIGGFLELKANVLRVSRLLEVEGSVDFSTGNVKFDGSIQVRDAVRDRFEIMATEDVIVEGLIEAATISAGRNFVSRRGIAARHRGMLRVEGNAEAGFMNDVKGYVRGDLLVRKEILNSDLAVGGNLSCQDGNVLGGSIAVMKRAKIGVLGSEGGAVTTLSLGAAPLLLADLRQLESRIEKMRRVLEQQAAILAAMPKGKLAKSTGVQPIVAEIKVLRDKIAAHEAERESIQQQIRSERLIELHVSKMLFPKVCLRAFDTSIIIGKPIKGPIVVMWDPENGLHYRQGTSGAPQELPTLNR